MRDSRLDRDDKKKMKVRPSLEFEDIEAKQQQDITYPLFIPVLQNACNESS